MTFLIVCNRSDLHDWILDPDAGGRLLVVHDQETVPSQDEGHGEENEGVGAGGPAVHLGSG